MLFVLSTNFIGNAYKNFIMLNKTMLICSTFSLNGIFFNHLFPGMSHYMCNITCFVLSSTLFKFLQLQTFGLILHILLFLF